MRATRPVALALLLAVTVVGVLTAGLLVADRARAGQVSVSEEPMQVAVSAEPSGDPVTLDVSVFTPERDAPGADDDGRRAVVLLAHGFGGTKASVEEQARDAAREGYVVLTWTARGFGASGGRIHLDAPDYEVADVSRLLDLLASRDDVRLDGEGDPRVGIAGGSYGGAVALMAAAYDDRVDAVVPAITWNDLAQGLFPQSARDDGGTPVGAGVFKQRWASLFFAAGLAPGSDATQTAACGRFDPAVCALYTEAATTGRPSPDMLDLLRRSSPAPVLDRVTAPTLLLQGEQDSLFPLDQADATAGTLAAAGTTVAVRWVDGGHDGAADLSTLDGFADATLGWFDHYLRGGPDPDTAFEFTLPAPLLGGDPPERLTTPTYDDVERRPVALAGDPQELLSPPGGQPAALTTLPGTGPLLTAADGLGGSAGYRLAALPGESAVFETDPLPEATTVAGAPRLRLSVTSTTTDATLFVSVWVVAVDRTASLPRRLVAPVRLDGLVPGEPREVEVDAPTSAYRVERGQRLRLLVTSTDAAYAVPVDARGYQVALVDQALEVPVVDAQRVAGSGGLAPTPLVVAVVVLLAAAAGLALLGRRRRRTTSLAELREVPLSVSGLVKEYANGFRAVDDISWRAERGQVVGLLGPNGAGKTTTMRMLVGLIAPDAGAVHVLGEEVGPGAAVLGRVGALIEGPGFLPHLTGRENLRAYWAATGRPAEQAGLDDALAIADLGVAADKPVRSYSQGMRQRLGIAQSMLGQPDLLLLDEPTNGLDPPQIKAMRAVLTRYAASGRTVVVSSHLLAEVEQTCSHVIVMHRGRVVLQGAVADLVEGSSSTQLSVAAAPEQARQVLVGLDGVRAVTVESAGDDEGRLRVHGDLPRPRLVEALVAAGVPVSAVDGRRHLEEVFMGLVGEGEPAQVDPRLERDEVLR